MSKGPKLGTWEQVSYVKHYRWFDYNETRTSVERCYVYEARSIGLLLTDSTEGTFWCRGWSGPAVDALKVVAGLSS